MFEIGRIGRREAPAFFDIEKNYRAFGKAFAAYSCCGGLDVIGDAFQCVGLIAQFAGSWSTEKGEKTIAEGMEEFTFAGPGIGFCLWRIAQPVAGKGELLPQDLHGIVAGIIVAITTEKDFLLRGLWRSW